MKHVTSAELIVPAIDLARESDFAIGELRVSPSVREVRTPAGSETVEPRVLQALVCLYRAQGAVVSRDALIQTCWGGRIVSEDAINRCIAKLRSLSEGGSWFVIETIPRVGYRLSIAEKPVSEPKAQPEISICVLPFVNMSDDPQQEYFADGITEDIITDLHKIASLFVIARNIAFRFKGTHVDLPRAAQELNVRYFLEGSVRKVGGRVRITAQLVNGQTGGHVWAERYDRDLENIFALQDEISFAIVQALQLTLDPEVHDAIARRGTTNAQAYSLYLLARQTYVVSSACDLRSAEAIIRVCKRATEIDPSYAQAWALMAMGQSKQMHFNGAGDAGVAAAQRALALNPELAEPHAVLARFYFDNDHQEETDAELTTALRLDPESFEVNRIAGLLAYRRADFENARRYWEKAFSLMERDINAGAMVISSYYALGDMEGVRRAAQTALARAEKALAMDPLDAAAMGYSAYALAALGDMDCARERMERALLLEPTNISWQYNFACALAKYVRAPDEALAVLEPLLDRMGRGFLKHVTADPDLSDLYDDPRFQALVARAHARLDAETAAAA